MLTGLSKQLRTKNLRFPLIGMKCISEMKVPEPSL